MGKVTKKMLEEYRKTKADIPILQAELENMRQGEAGIGTSVIMDYKKGYPRPQSVSGFDWPLYERRQKALQKKQENCQAVERWIEEIEDGRTRTLEEVGKEFNVTRERIRQIEAKALRKLRHPSRSKKLKDFLD